MHRFTPLRLTILVSLVWFVTGCTGLTPSAQTQLRIQEKNASFVALNENQKNDILGGAIERGNSPDQVYMALGKPTKIVSSADGIKSMWVYVEYYRPAGAASLQPNNRNASHYQTGLVTANTPYRGPPNLPGQSPPSFMNPANEGPAPALDLPDLQSKTVYVFFHLGKVTEIKLDGDSSDQRTAAPNAAPKKNSQQDRVFHVI